MTDSLTPRVAVGTAHDGSSAVLTLATENGPLRVQVEAAPCRLLVGLLLGDRARPVDVSAQPQAFTGPLTSDDEGSPEDAVAVRRWLTASCQRNSLRARPNEDLDRTVTGACFPLLGLLYDRGATTLPGIPRWAATALVEPDPRRAAMAVLSPRPSRPLIAALASSLLPDTSTLLAPRLHPLALAIMGSGVLAVDELTGVIRAATHAEQPGPIGWPTVDEIIRFQRLAPTLGSLRARRILHDAAVLPAGARLLARTMVLYEGLPAGVQGTLPRGLSALHERCRALTPIDPGTRPPVASPTARPRPRGESAARRPDAPRTTAPRQALTAPATSGRAAHPNAPFSYAPSVGRLHARLVTPHLRLVLPRTGQELAAWGQRLHNCLGSFAAAVAAGRSLLVGVERGDVLTYCAEVAPSSRTVRQFHGPYNHSVPAEVVAAVCSVLVRQGVLDRHAPANHPWLSVVGSVTTTSRSGT